MIRSVLAIAAVAFVTVALASPVLAQAPSVSKRVVVEDNETIVMLSVSAADRSVYGIYVEDATASIRDIKVPKGWVGISSGNVILFRTLEEPITFGDTSNLKKCQIVIALGNPYNIARDGDVSASWGVISNLGRRAPASPDSIRSDSGKSFSPW